MTGAHSGSFLTVRGSPRQHGTSAWEPGDSRSDPDCTSDSGLLLGAGAESQTPSNTCSKCESNPELWVHCHIARNYKEKKLGAKHNLMKEEELKNQGIFEDGYRYPATWYRYPRDKLTPSHVET
ncbi:hypothetical protein PIB30_088308 [Stylosanthes scabra]|uniref:Uncharacterized protein n=1 Tax=Stylosanthes scabra TaxID=79078 RepID=A0ABU6XTC5_9FABA|nr:hypothetical protein [Stylosanthes scabra]